MTDSQPPAHPPRSVLIVDDEAHARRNLELALADHTGWRLAGTAETCAEARACLDAGPVDLLLLDIKLRQENGLTFALEVGARADAPLVAFVTAYDDHAIEAFDLFALDYLLKPFDDARFARLLARAGAMLDMRDRASEQRSLMDFAADRAAATAGTLLPFPDAFIVRSIGRTERVPVSEMVWIKAAGNYVELVAADRILLHRATMGSVEKRLKPADFLRVHRTAIVRRSAIRQLEVLKDGTYQVALSNGDKVPVSARRVEDVRAEFKKTPD